MQTIKLFGNGGYTVTTLPEAEHTVFAMQKAINARIVQFVPLRKALAPGYVLVVDEEFLFSEKIIKNPLASALYEKELDFDYPVFGDALILKDRETEDGIDTVGLDESDIQFIVPILENTKGN